MAATNDRLEETIQPACEAGGESASPRRWRSRAWGTIPTHDRAHESGRQMKREQPGDQGSRTTLCRPLRRLPEIGSRNPSPSPGANTLSASFAGSLDDSPTLMVE